MPLFEIKFFGSRATTLKTSKKEMKDILRIIKSLEESGSLIKHVSRAIKNEVRKKRRISPGFVKYISC